MKTFIQTSMLCIAITSIGFSQKESKPNVEQRIERNTKVLVKKLDLNENQASLLEQENNAYWKQKQLLKQERIALKEKSIAQKEAIKQEIAPILSPEQQQKMAELKKAKKEKKHPFHNKKEGVKKTEIKEKRAELSPEELAEKKANSLANKLDLTEEQKLKIKAIHIKNAPANAKLKETKQTLKEKHITLEKAHQDKIASILTPEQITKYNLLKEERKAKANSRRELKKQ